jgi:undecaprenyl pyrophosphate phosphatase UppP
MNKLATILCLLFLHFTAFSQEVTEQIEMADVMRSNGKIYIVVATCVTILLGLLFYVWRLDRKITALENAQK